MTPAQTADYVAAEVRAEMARQNKLQLELANVLGITEKTAGVRLRGTVPFNVIELAQVAAWLGVPVGQFYPGTDAVA